MNDEILKRLDLLASKLGVTAGHLWIVLTAQAKIEGFENLAWAAVWFSLAVFAGLVSRAAFRDENGHHLEVGIILAGVCGACVLISFAMVSGTPGMLFNPEYWALKQVLETLKK